MSVQSARFGLIVVLFVGASPLPVRAQDATTQAQRDAEARQLFEAGRLAFDDARYEDALLRFRDAHRMSGRPELLYNIGQCLDRLRRDSEAAETFEQYLAASPDAPNRHEVQQRLEILHAAIAHGALAPPERVTAAVPTEPLATSIALPAAALSAAPPDEARHATQTYEEWWFWTIIGVVVVAGVAIPVAVVASSSTSTVDNPIPGDYGPGGVVIALSGP